MQKEVTSALAEKDYKRAQKLLKQWQTSDPHNPWMWFHVARLYEETNKPEKAEKIYRQLLRKVTTPKLLTQARQGLDRLQTQRTQQQQTVVESAVSHPGGDSPGILVLEPIPSAAKQTAAQKFARIFQIDAYNARLQLPSRGWRLYRTGAVGELKYYTQGLQEVEIPCFCLSLDLLDSIQVYQLTAFTEFTPRISVTYQADGQTKSFTFEWSEVQRRVEGRLPLFESVVDTDSRRKLQRKMQILDYIPFCDLHLPSHQTILRLCDRVYNFQTGISLTPDPVTTSGQTTTRTNWLNLMRFLNENLPEIETIGDFEPFAETALGFPQLLGQIDPHISLNRRHETLWDAAFHLYSGAIFLLNGLDENSENQEETNTV
jgi:tetratricopeptide (TPR) repeat protein